MPHIIRMLVSSRSFRHMAQLCRSNTLTARRQNRSNQKKKFPFFSPILMIFLVFYCHVIESLNTKRRRIWAHRVRLFDRQRSLKNALIDKKTLGQSFLSNRWSDKNFVKRAFLAHVMNHLFMNFYQNRASRLGVMAFVRWRTPSDRTPKKSYKWW